jgi:hypothetical protein
MGPSMMLIGQCDMLRIWYKMDLSDTLYREEVDGNSMCYIRRSARAAQGLYLHNTLFKPRKRKKETVRCPSHSFRVVRLICRQQVSMLDVLLRIRSLE